MPKCLAIIPAYNEEGAIGSTIADVRACAPEFDVLVIDDGSTDATRERALAAGARVVRLPFNLGIGGAVQTGYRWALAGGYELAVQVDGDGQHDARDIPRLRDALLADEDLNMVTGSRFLDCDEGGYRSSITRRFGIRIFCTIMSRITGRRITDPTSGFRMCDRKGIELFARDYPHDYPEVEAILMMHANSLRGHEVPVTMRERATGLSSIGPGTSAYYMVKVLLAIAVGLLRVRPVVLASDKAPVSAQPRF